MTDETPLPEGWVEYPGADGARGARKRFDDHYKEVLVAADGDLIGTLKAIDLEAYLRGPAKEKADREARIEELRSELADLGDSPAPDND